MTQWTGRLFGSARKSGGEHWLTISDLMAGLMMVFLLIAIALMRNAYDHRDSMLEVAEAYRDSRIGIDEELRREFESDLDRWSATIDSENLTFEFRFRTPEVLFQQSAATLEQRFKDILDDFFPRYLRVLRPFSTVIDEVRIEGHTSSEWFAGGVAPDRAYFNNMKLSQDRARAVLDYVYMPLVELKDREWVRSNVAAVGLSSSRLVKDPSGQEDRERSRRVLFRVVTNAETQIHEILAR